MGKFAPEKNNKKPAVSLEIAPVLSYKLLKAEVKPIIS